MAWKKFFRGKKQSRAVRVFWLALEKNLEILYQDLVSGRYQHGSYKHFVRHDSKRRDIFVAAVRDRVVHQLVSDELEKIYARRFYAHSYAAQRGKGVHAARKFFDEQVRRARARGSVWIAKLDVEQFYASVSHIKLLAILRQRIIDPQLFILCKKIIKSFGLKDCGLPLGNLTSQWLGNIYLHELDWFVKHSLGVRQYLRYNDDLFIFGNDELVVRTQVSQIRRYVSEKLFLKIPDHKISICRLPRSIDVLGICTNGDYEWVRSVTRRRVRARLRRAIANCSTHLLDQIVSYQGIRVYEFDNSAASHSAWHCGLPTRLTVVVKFCKIVFARRLALFGREC